MIVTKAVIGPPDEFLILVKHEAMLKIQIQRVARILENTHIL